MHYKVQGFLRARIIIVMALLFLGLGLIVFRVIQLQVLQRDLLSDWARDQYKYAIELPPLRGEILDRNGEALAISQEMRSVIARPYLIKNPEDTAQKLANILNMDYKEVRARLEPDPDNRRSVWIKRIVDPEQAEPIRLLKPRLKPAVELVPESKRYYPNGGLAAAVIGFAGIDSQGLEGLELKYNEILKGQMRYIPTFQNARGGPIMPARSGINGEPLFEVDEAMSETWKGTDLVLTIDRPLQYIAEKEIKAAAQKYGAKRGGVIIMDPQTGAILAMAMTPGFDPNNYSDYPKKIFRNWMLTDVYEPGSPMKVVTVSSALEEGVVKPDDVFYCENGTYQVGNHEVHDVGKHGALTVEQIIAFSSCIGASKIAQKMGRQRMYEYIKAYGFGERTGIDFPGERRGVVPEIQNWPEIALANISFGQGISVTPLQMLNALATIANRGVRMKPYLVEKIVRPDGTVQVMNQPQRVRTVISPQAAKTITDILQIATSPKGTGFRAAIEGYPVAGKTGTAQKPYECEPGRECQRGYAEGKHVLSFVGFVPADDPAIAMIIILDEPDGEDMYGGTCAAPVFKEIAKQALVRLGIPPKGQKSSAIAMAANERLNPLNPKKFEEKLTREDLELLQNKVPEGILRTKMPDLSGLTIRQVLRRLDPLDMEVRIEGSGIAVEQHPKPDTMLSGVSECLIKFAPPR